MRYSLLAIVALLFFAACDKVEVPASDQEMLRNGKWQLKVKATKQFNYSTQTYQIDTLIKSECEEDDYIVFRENFDGAHIPGEMLCTASETIEMPFRWGLTDNDTKMFIYDGASFFGTDVNADFVNFNGSEFTLMFNTYTTIDSVPRTDTVMHTMVFTKM